MLLYGSSPFLISYQNMEESELQERPAKKEQFVWKQKSVNLIPT